VHAPTNAPLFFPMSDLEIIADNSSSTQSMFCLFHLYKRAIMASPPLFHSKYEAKKYRTLQIKSLQVLLNLSTNLRGGKKQQRIDRNCLAIAYIELPVTTTPPSMMIGYQDMEEDLELLRLASAYDQNLNQISLDELMGFGGNELMSSIVSIDNRRRHDEAHDDTSKHRIRIGFISSFLYDHSVGRLIEKVITNLNKTTFKVSVIAIKSPFMQAYDANDEYAYRIHSAAETFLTLPLNIPSSIIYRYKDEGDENFQSLKFESFTVAEQLFLDQYEFAFNTFLISLKKKMSDMLNIAITTLPNSVCTALYKLLTPLLFDRTYSSFPLFVLSNFTRTILPDCSAGYSHRKSFAEFPSARFASSAAFLLKLLSFDAVIFPGDLIANCYFIS
jgi:hypothetical protein